MLSADSFFRTALLLICPLLLYAQTPANPMEQSASLGMPDLATSVRLKFAVVESQQGFLPCGADFLQNRQAEIANALQTFPDIQHNPAILCPPWLSF